MKKNLERLLALLLVLCLSMGTLASPVFAAEQGDDTAFGSDSLAAEQTLAWTNDAVSEGTMKTLLNSIPLYPQKTGWSALDSALDSFFAPYEGKDTYTKLRAAYDYLVKNITYSWDGYSKKTAPAYEYFTELNYLKNMTYDSNLKKAIPDDMANRAYHVLAARKGVCYDYAIALAVMARYIGLESYVHTGYFVFEDTANGSGHHGWTVLRLNGSDYVFDSQRDARNWQYYKRNGYYFGITYNVAHAKRYFTNYDAKANAARDASMLPLQDAQTLTNVITTKVEGKGTVTGAGTYPAGTKVTLTATPKDGSSFLGWYDRNNTYFGNQLTYSWTPKGNTTVTARFGAVITVSGSKDGTVTGSGSYVSGQTVTLLAAPNTGVNFTGWYDSAGNLLSKNLSYSFPAEKSMIIYARFVDPANAVTVTTLTEGSGTVTGGGSYTKGDTVTLKATPAKGYVFLGWYDRENTNWGDDLTFSWTVAGNTTMTAKFGVALNVKASSTGAAAISGNGKYAVGETVTLTATPKSGYTFTGWYTTDGTPISKDAVYTCKVAQGGTLVAMFSGDPFLDVSAGAWYRDAVAESVRRDLIKGVNAITFQPDSSLTRAQVVTVLARMARNNGFTTDGAASCGFQDVPQTAWYAADVNWAYSKGIVNGITATTFGPNQSISRQDFLVMVSRFLKNIWEIEPEAGAITFRDAGTIASYALTPVRQGVAMGLINGYQEADGSYTFRPKGTLLRKEGVKVLVALAQYLDTHQPEEPEKPDPEPDTVTLTDATYGLKLTVDKADKDAVKVDVDEEDQIIFAYYDPKSAALSEESDGLVWGIRVQDRAAYESWENIGMGENGWPLWDAGVTHCILARDDKYYYQLVYPINAELVYDSVSYPDCQSKSYAWLTAFIKENGLTASPTLGADYQTFCQWVQSLAKQDAAG